jgi:steroid delta-isomerase
LSEVLDRHVAGFNEGVRTGDWSAMLAQLDDDAELEFAGIPVGPFAGKAAIAEAYRAQPPDDELVALESLGEHAIVYAWSSEPSRPAGELHLTVEDGRVTRIRVLYEQFSQ